MRIQILPSLLAGDFGKLEQESKRAEAAGADALHIDVMDGVFVPNISFGPDVVEMARRAVSIPLSVHLMIARPDQYVSRFVDAGADSILIHIESECDVMETLARIRDLGVKAGITLNPETPPEMVFPVIESVDEVLCMTVRPGYGGQAFMPEVLPKVRALRNYAGSMGRSELRILVDGGICLETAQRCTAHGADSLVAGTSLYHAENMSAALHIMRRKAAESLAL